MRVDDNSPVQPGELLVRIDPSTIRAQADQARAGQAQASAQLDPGRSPDRRRPGPPWSRPRTRRGAAEAQAVKAAKDLERYQALRRLNAAAVSQEQLDQVAAAAANTAAQRDAALRQVKGAGAQLAASRTQLTGARARVESAKAQVRQSGVNLTNTAIIAPVAGTIANKTVAAGDYVQPGQQLMAIVPHRVWITANFKETQLALIRPGQPAQVKVDGCRGLALWGTPSSAAPARRSACCPPRTPPATT